MRIFFHRLGTFSLMASAFLSLFVAGHLGKDIGVYPTAFLIGLFWLLMQFVWYRVTRD